MKKLFVVLLTLCMLFSMTACFSSPVSGITIADLESGFSIIEPSFEVRESQNGDDLCFSSITSDFIATITITGYADKNQNVKSVTILNEDVDTSLLSTTSSIKNTVRKPSEKMTLNDLGACYCFIEVLDLYKIFGGSDEFSEDDFFAVFANGKELVVNGWTISVRMDSSSETVEVNAEYK